MKLFWILEFGFWIDNDREKVILVILFPIIRDPKSQIQNLKYVSARCHFTKAR